MDRRRFLTLGLTGPPAALLTRRQPGFAEPVDEPEDHPDCPNCRCWDPVYDYWMQKKTKNSDMSYHRDVSICGYRVDTENLDGEPEDLSIKIEDRSPGTIVGWSSGCGLSVNVYETCQCRCHDKAEDMWEKVGYPPPSFANYPLTVT